MTIRHPNDSISRRRFLRGLGIAMSLPWLESLNSWGAAAANVSGESGAPRRMAVCFMGNGVNPHQWGATNGAGGLELMKSLTPLEALKDQLLVCKGLWNPTTLANPGGHRPKMNLLSGLTVKQTTTDVQVGTSMDQLVAAEAGKHTPMSSIVLGTESPSYNTDSGFASLYSAYLSWSSPTSPAPKEIYPQQAFDQLFDDGSQRKRDKSVLDLVNEDAKSLRTRLSQHDVHKLDEYLTSVRELEERIERADTFSKTNTAGLGWQPSVKAPTFPRPAAGIPAHPDEHLRLMFDIMVLAFQMDRTRVATFMMNNDISGMNFGFEGMKGGLHELSHHAGDPARLDQYQRVNEHHMQLWSEALQKMAATNEGERSLLDNSMMLFTSSLFDGNVHDSRQLPVLLAGGGGGTIRGGRMLDYSKDENRKLCRLHMALMDRMGCKTSHFGDADLALSDLG